MYEDRHTPPLPPRRFVRRMADHVALAAVLVFVSLLVGMWGYEHYEHLPWRDAFVNTAMLLGGMGPVDPLHSNGGKGFAGRAGGAALTWTSISGRRARFSDARPARCGRSFGTSARSWPGAQKAPIPSVRSTTSAI